MKNKYLKKKKKDGVEPSFKKPHDPKCFDLSKKIWTDATKETKTKTILKESEAGVEKFDADERALHIKQLKLHSEQLKLHSEQLKLITEYTELELEKAQLVLKAAAEESTHAC
ncbi:hypothetical protein ACFE04_027934 [Oxalis oulophora]